MNLNKVEFLDIKKSLTSNIWKYAIILILNKRFFAAILSVYYLTIPNINIQKIGIIMLVANLMGFVFEIPSGYLSDNIGHKKTIIISRVLMVLSSLFFLIGYNFYMIVLGAVFFTLSNSFLSGTGQAFMYETFQALKRGKDFTKIMGKISSLGFLIPVVLTIIIPFLVNISYKLPFAISLFFDVIALKIAISLRAPDVIQKSLQKFSLNKLKSLLKDDNDNNLIPIVMIFGLLGGALFSLGAFRAPYQDALNIPVIYFGVLFGIGRILASIILFYSDAIKKVFSLNSFFKFIILTNSVLILLLGVFKTPYLVAFIFILLNAIQHGLRQVQNSFLLEKISNSNNKATFLSVVSQFRQLTNGVIVFVLGVMIQNISFSFGFIGLSIFLFILSITFYLFHKNILEKGFKNKKFNFVKN